MSFIKVKTYKTISDISFHGTPMYFDLDSTYLYRRIKHSNIVLGYLEKCDEEDKITHLTSSSKPAKRASLYVAPKCKVAVDDIRKNYTVKRTIDSGDYNVMTNRFGYKASVYKVNIAFSRKYNVLAASCSCDSVAAFRNFLSDSSVLLADIKNEDIDMIAFGTELAFYYADDLIMSILDNKVKKPIVTVDCLDLSSAMNPDADTLRLLIAAGLHACTRDNLKKFEMQLCAYNQYNWREYPLSWYVTKDILTNCGCAGRYVINRPNSAPKAAKALLSVAQYFDNVMKEATEEDYNVS